MNSIKALSRETISLQLKSLVIFDFLNTYNEFEKCVRNVFENSIQFLLPSKKQQLYFLYGGKLGTYIEYREPSLKLTSIQYREDEQFRELSINQILKIFQADSCIDAFNFQIESLQKSTTVYPFIDCAVKLINMRNKLAHELTDLQFSTKDLIELLAIDNIKKESFSILQNYDINNMDNMTQHIASNVIYMRKIIVHLKSSVES